MSEGPPIKRVRQACDQCRRKKSRCPGERPVCSYCARLDINCTYGGPVPVKAGRIPKPPQDALSQIDATDRVNGPQTPVSIGVSRSDTAERLSNLESQLANVLTALRTPSQQQNPSGHTPILTPAPVTLHIDKIPPSWQSIRESVGAYLMYCHCQPLPLFNASTLLDSLKTRDEELVYSIMALGTRFVQGQQNSTLRDEPIKRYSEAATDVVMQRISAGNIELSTLQSLCLLSLVEFNHGNSHRASTYISLAMDLSQSAKLSNSCVVPPSSPLQEEQMRCFWSIVLLTRLYGNMSGPFSTSLNEQSVPCYPQSQPRPALHQNELEDTTSASRIGSDYPDLGINAYVIQLSEIWKRVVGYAHRRRSPGKYPPWSSESEYARILAQQMERETHMPYSVHRFKPAKFPERSPEELAEHRDYWGPWLLNQMMYHTIICLLNHPLLLSIRLRSFKVASVPEIWLQQTDDFVSAHTQWVVYLIELVEAKSFLVSDPFFARCVAIVATIYLQQSFVEDVALQRAKRRCYETCLDFCLGMGKHWPGIESLAKKLQRFEQMVSKSYQDSAHTRARDKVYIDLTLFWEILESSLVSEEPDRAGITFGASLVIQHKISAAAEELDTRLLPEPSRLNDSNAESLAGRRESSTSSISANPHDVPFVDHSGAPNDDFAVLAQSYFAQGQDFVGSLDDWWTLDQI